MDDNLKNFGVEYGRLVLKELERINENTEQLRKDFDKKFAELNEKMSDFKNTEKDVADLQEWKNKVTEVWSTTQMKESKNEVYNQKNQWGKVTGIVLVVTVVVQILIAFGDKLIK